jgi:hypothetical protein
LLLLPQQVLLLLVVVRGVPLWCLLCEGDNWPVRLCGGEQQRIQLTANKYNPVRTLHSRRPPQQQLVGSHHLTDLPAGRYGQHAWSDATAAASWASYDNRLVAASAAGGVPLCENNGL